MSVDRKVPSFLNAWVALLASDEPVDLAVIKELAKRHRVTRGMWQFYTGTSVNADLYWKKVVTAIAEKRLSCHAASVSQSDGSRFHLFRVYNKGFTDENDVFQVERTLRSMGIHTRMHYTPNIFAHLDIRLGNEWPDIRIKPFIYKSEYQSHVIVYVYLSKLKSN